MSYQNIGVGTQTQIACINKSKDSIIYRFSDVQIYSCTYPIPECLDGWMKDCTLLDELPEPGLPVKYPRTPGYRPSPEENTHNAW